MKRTWNRIWLFIMQKWLIIPILVAIIAGAALLVPKLSRFPDAAEDGTLWDRHWEMLGTVLGVEDPGYGFRLLNNDTALAGDDTYYASWVTGEPVEYLNSEGRNVDLYPAQIYLLLYGCADEASAEAAKADWTARASDTNAVHTRREEAHNLRPYDVLVYTCVSGTNPYGRGADAFTRYGRYVAIAEVLCTDAFDGDEAALLGAFLDGCHYGTPD